MANEQIVTDVGEVWALDQIVAVGMTLGLFSDDELGGKTIVQVDALDETDFTAATFAGYAAKVLTPASWTVTAGNPSTAVYADQTWTRSSTGTLEAIYGATLTRTSDASLIGVIGFGSWSTDAVPVFSSAPVNIEFINDAITITPTITLHDDTDVPA